MVHTLKKKNLKNLFFNSLKKERERLEKGISEKWDGLGEVMVLGDLCKSLEKTAILDLAQE